MSFLSKTTFRVACVKGVYRWARVPYFAAQV